MRINKTKKGITLVALIITIVVLLILSVVAITAVQEDGIFAQAQNVASKYNQAQRNEQTMLEAYLGVFEADKSARTIEEAQSNKMLSKRINSTVYDEYGNKIVVPAGFKIRVDEGERTAGDEKSKATRATEGIVIEDESGNQFVWVPVGNVYTTTDTEKTTSNTKTITLGRYSWSGSTPTRVQPIESKPYTTNVGIKSGSYSYTELQPTENGKGPYGNAIARNINDFYESATENGGYYIGRYEAGNENNALVCKTNQTVYVNVTQSIASSLSQGMYVDGYSSNGTVTFSSDLVNSYAWDTAIVFIQTFGGEAASDYAIQNASEDFGGFTTTGGIGDEYCNINDMSGNAWEWTTETSSAAHAPCTPRGGYSFNSNGTTSPFTSNRISINSNSSSSLAFRPILYVGL